MCVYGGSRRHWLMFLVSQSNTVIPLYGETITKKSSISHCFSPPAYFVFFYYFSPTGFHSTLKSFIQFHFEQHAKYDKIFAPSCFHKNFFLWKDTFSPPLRFLGFLFQQTQIIEGELRSWNGLLTNFQSTTNHSRSCRKSSYPPKTSAARVKSVFSNEETL